MLKSHLTALVLFVSAAIFQPTTASADIGTPATAEILPGWLRSDGSRIAAVKITLAQGWKTYWRSPGDAGIPPQFDWSGSANLQDVAIVWPTPKVFRENGTRTIGYAQEVILPIHIAPRRTGKPVKLRADLDVGICKDICAPYQFDLSATLANTNTTPVPAIAAAMAARPFEAGEAGVQSAICALRPNDTGLEITARLTLPPTGGREVVVIEPHQPGVWMSETDTTRQGNLLVATGDLVPPDRAALALERAKIVITVLGKNQAVEIIGCTP